MALGVKEYYFTGSEPFLNRDMVPILVETFRYGPATVLTNGTVFKDPWLRTLAEAERLSRYTLEFRVSTDGSSRRQTTRSAGWERFSGPCEASCN